MMKQWVMAGALMGAMPMVASADFIGLFIGGGVWDHDVSGSAAYQGDDLDVASDLALGSNRDSYLWLALEHPVPLLPNVRVFRLDLSMDGNTTVTSSFRFGGQNYDVGEEISSITSLDQVGGIFYYELLDNVLSFDLGLDIRNVKGDATVTSITTGVTESATFDVFLPMLFARAQVDLPFTGLSVGAEGSMVGYGGSTLSDVRGWVAWESPFRVGAELGYRSYRLELDDVDDVTADLTTDGPYAALFVHF